MRLVICDDLALLGSEWLDYLNGSERPSVERPEPIAGLTHAYSLTNFTGGSAHLWNTVQDVAQIKTRLRKFPKVVAHTSNMPADHIYCGKDKAKQLIKLRLDGKRPQVVRYAENKILDPAFPLTGTGTRQKGMVYSGIGGEVTGVEFSHFVLSSRTLF